MKNILTAGLLLWTPLVWAADPATLPDEAPPSPFSAAPRPSASESTSLNRGVAYALSLPEEHYPPRGIQICASADAEHKPITRLWSLCIGRNAAKNKCMALSMMFAPVNPLRLESQHLTEVSITASKSHMPCLLLGAFPALQRLNLSVRYGSQEMPDGTEKRATKSPIFTFPHTPHGETDFPCLTYVDFAASHTYPSTVPAWMAHKGVLLSHALLLEHTHLQGQCGWGAFYDQDKHFGYEQKLNNQFPVASFAADDIGQLWSDIHGLQPYTLTCLDQEETKTVSSPQQNPSPKPKLPLDLRLAQIMSEALPVEMCTKVLNCMPPKDRWRFVAGYPSFAAYLKKTLFSLHIHSTRKIPEGQGWEDEGIDIDTALHASFPMLKAACLGATNKPLKSLIVLGHQETCSAQKIQATLNVAKVLDPDSEAVKAFALTVMWELENSVSKDIPFRPFTAGPFYVRCDLEAETRPHYYAKDMITLPDLTEEEATYIYPRPVTQEDAEAWLIQVANHLAMESLNAWLPKPYEISSETTSAEGPGGEEASAEDDVAEGADRAPTQGPPPASSKNPDVSKEGDC
ncbi:hypothetical protein EIL50_04480 [bacterium NHP-B]|nr:hypothetical protein EIL50_04480 [bacterium NHP-B]